MRRNRFLEGYRREPSGPPPPATKENWLAAGAHLVAGALALLSFPVVHLLAVFGVTYGAGLAMGAWYVRPAERRRRVFPLLMLPLVVQAAIYILYWYPVAAFAMSGDGTGSAGSPIDTTSQSAAFRAGLAALSMGWAPSLFLHLFARRARLLIAVQIAGPMAAVVFWVLAWVAI